MDPLLFLPKKRGTVEGSTIKTPQQFNRSTLNYSQPWRPLPWATDVPQSSQAPKRTGWSKPTSSVVVQNKSSSVSSERMRELMNSFKDDMQKMNERTYVRVNGVKVCKVSE